MLSKQTIRRGMKELARFPDLGSCYNAAKVDSDCDITHGVAYAVQANDPTDTWRADRCTCVRKTCNGPWHATDRIFARYGDPFLVTNVLAPSGAHDVFCDGARGMKELARFPDLGSCYNAAKVDSDCDI